MGGRSCGVFSDGGSRCSPPPDWASPPRGRGLGRVGSGLGAAVASPFAVSSFFVSGTEFPGSLGGRGLPLPFLCFLFPLLLLPYETFALGDGGGSITELIFFYVGELTFMNVSVLTIYDLFL